MTMRDKIALSTVTSLVECDVFSGNMVWKERCVSFFSDGAQSAHHNCMAWNGKFSGKPAFTRRQNGYGCASILGIRLAAHRVVWAIAHGSWPEMDIDHMDGNIGNNAISNLRLVTHGQNMRNAGIRVDNKAGQAGVCWHKAKQKWHARITQDGVTKSLGYHLCIEDAKLARLRAQTALDFSHRHGKPPPPPSVCRKFVEETKT